MVKPDRAVTSTKGLLPEIEAINVCLQGNGAEQNVSSRFGTIAYLVVLVFAILIGQSAKAGILCMSQDVENAERSINIEGKVINSITGLGFKNDTIKVELLRPDSSLIGYTFTERLWKNYPSEMGISNRFIMQPKVTGKRFILRLSNPDFETVCYDINAPGVNYDAGKLGIRRLSRFEKSLMLGEVTVTASVVAFVNKGDTLQYNADAFNLAQGSMLDALIEQMPGVELRDDGRIYVNGRFVEKLLLDGKDFFKGNQLVMLQNLPAYSVKDIKVYEKASSATEVLGKSAQSTDTPDQYVMDVRLKKGYNNGWIANAEAGGGTHNRYRLRGFGMGYNKNFRLALYGMANNVNETRSPGRSGEWNPDKTSDGITITREGGIDYGYFRNNNELTGGIKANYTKTETDMIINRENFLTGGNTFTRTWSDKSLRQVVVQTEHDLTLRPSDGNSYNTHINVLLGYGNIKQHDKQTEGTFGASISDGNSLRDSIEKGMPESTDIINRYINILESQQKIWAAQWNQQSTFQLGSPNYGVTLSSDGSYQKKDYDSGDNYILQYKDQNPQLRARLNPKDEHRYRYWVGARGQIRLSSLFNLHPLYAVCHWYRNNSDIWYSDHLDSRNQYAHAHTSSRVLPSMTRDAVMRLDPQNSYNTGYHHTHQYVQLAFTYYKEQQKDGRKYSSLLMQLYGGANIMNRKLTFDGISRQVVKKDWIDPDGTFYAEWNMPGMAHRFSFNYNFKGTELDLMNLVDITFDSDPLHLRQGNPELKTGVKHDFNIGYESTKRLFGRLLLGLHGNYTFTSRNIAMSSAYDRTTGVRISKPINIDGGWNAGGSMSTGLNLTADGRFTLSNYLSVTMNLDVDMISYDKFATSQKTSINDLYLWNNFGLQYNIGKHMVGFDALIDNHHTTSDREDFITINVPSFNYGFRGRVMLPFDIELSTDIKMYQRRGHDDSSMNINTLLWNGRISKNLLNDRLIVAVDGYDILGNVKSIGYSVNALGRTETWTKSIPSYVMLSLRWNFTKKPKE